jgi:hypothetical protein
VLFSKAESVGGDMAVSIEHASSIVIVIKEEDDGFCKQSRQVQNSRVPSA